MKKVLRFVLIILLVIAVILISRLIAQRVDEYFIKRDLASDDASIIMTLRSPMDDRSANETKLYRHNLEGPILLVEGYDLYDMVSSQDGSKILAFMGGWEQFDIVEYDLQSKALNRVLSTDEIQTYLTDNGYMEQGANQSRYGYCLRYYHDENCISFLYKDFLMGYSEEKGLEVIYTLENFGHAYSWIKDDTALLIGDGGIVEYDADTGERTILFEQAHTFNFTVSPDETFLVYEERDTGYLCRYDLADGTRKELCRYGHPHPNLQLDKNGKYLLCQDAKDILTSYKLFLYVIDIENGRKWKAFECGIGTPLKSTQITGVTWN